MSETTSAPPPGRVWLLLALVALMLSTVPLLAASAVRPPETLFMGAVLNSGDASAYLAGMRQGAVGATRYTIPFTPEPVTPRVMYTFYLVLGQMVARVGGAMTAWWHGARLAAAVLALAALALLTARALPGDREWGRTAYFLLLFGGGMGWLLRLAARFVPLPATWWPDVAVTEWSPVLILGNPPHFSLGLALLALLMAAVITLETTPNRARWALVAAAAAALLGLLYPYAVPLSAAVLGVYVLVELAFLRRHAWRRFLPLAPIAILLVVYGYYYGAWLPADPLWMRLNITQNGVPPPPLPGVIIGLGLLGGLALLGGGAWLATGGSRLLPVWAATQLLLLALPLPYAGRFAFGITMPFALLAATAVERTMSSRLSRGTWLKPLLLLLLTPSLLLGLLLETRAAMAVQDWPLYAPAAEVAAMEWLAEQTAEEDVILVYHQIGNWLPRYAPGRVFIGQKFATIDPDEKATLVVSFWHEGAPAGWREALLADWNVDWIYYGRYEKAITTGDVQPPGRRVYARDGVEIFRVAP